MVEQTELGLSYVWDYGRIARKLRGINDQQPIYMSEVLLAHIGRYADEFRHTEFATKYRNRNQEEFIEAIDDLQNVGFLAVDDRHEALNAIINLYDIDEAIYIDERGVLEKLTR